MTIFFLSTIMSSKIKLWPLASPNLFIFIFFFFTFFHYNAFLVDPFMQINNIKYLQSKNLKI